jgi:hypothetical protein
MRDVVGIAVVGLCALLWAYVVGVLGWAAVEALRNRRDLRRHRQLQKAKRPVVDRDLIARLEVELGFEEPEVPEVPKWIQRDWDRVAGSCEVTQGRAPTAAELAHDEAVRRFTEPIWRWP